ncbi:MAG: glycogen/starch/alpha-glucan phosphorylase, partial [Planctomycetes bacterium]|nr:glycogen/starch/alpha-glucan phosphorylase [Planctomycetota bacterium]
TIGTLDGANIEIRDEVGAENIFIFGLTAEEVEARRRPGGYSPRAVLDADAELREALELLFSGRFNEKEPGLFDPIREALLERGDYFLHLADLRAYVDCHGRLAELYRDADAWNRKAILNVARVGKFSSDRTIQEYAREIWDVRPTPVSLSDKRTDTIVQARMAREGGAGTG